MVTLDTLRPPMALILLDLLEMQQGVQTAYQCRRQDQ